MTHGRCCYNAHFETGKLILVKAKMFDWRLMFIVVALALVSYGLWQPSAAEEPAAVVIVGEENVSTNEVQQDNPPAAALAPELKSPPPPPEAEFLLPWRGDLSGMVDRRVIRILTVYSNGRYYFEGLRERGLTYELLKQYEQFVNEQLQRGHLKVHVVFVPVARGDLIPALLDGRGDLVVADLTITEERAKLVQFSAPFSKPISEILVTGPSAPTLTSIDDLAGKTMLVRESSSYWESLEALNKRFETEGKPAVIMHGASERLEDDDLIEMVNSGLLPWAIVDSYKPQLWEGVFTDLEIREDIEFRVGGRLAWAFRKGSPELEASANKFLKKHREGTLLGNILVNRYIRDFDWAANALADEDFARLEQVLHLFRDYGEQYGIDYLLSAAQGYQESRLRQEARSNAGAVGIMQLLPATAAGKSVDINDIQEVEPNIHAGIKYLDYLRDRYFSDDEIDPLDQTLLALAAYNAGPSRMINLRNEAERSGYDPNIWFDNVEVIAAKRIGRETVQYVANIYKYYLAYRLTMNQVVQARSARAAAGLGNVD